MLLRILHLSQVSISCLTLILEITYWSAIVDIRDLLLSLVPSRSSGLNPENHVVGVVVDNEY